jgi:hypothetical protein
VRSNLLLFYDIPPMRKLYISLGLALLLLTAQLGAVLHEVSHICRVSTNVHQQMHADTALEKICDLCVAYSQLANPFGNSVDVARFEPSSCAAGLIWPCAVNAVDVPTPRSRGPPSSAPRV